MGAPLHSMVICGEMHEIEEQMYDYYLNKDSQPIPAEEEKKE